MFYRYNCGNGAREIMALIALQYFRINRFALG